eukprot:TRINITY_DN24108_c0_g1_i2.p1 TRINITY_DN24108_c0_g1~~TRINITY_DN24108_c0_g1_i2.p1  ORF type:complete len:103 (+),score=18.52 TRINITY_DN24108_c0_g1_i2:112-420(+)
MIRRPPRSTQGVSSAASDVYKRQTQSTWEELLGKRGEIHESFIKYNTWLTFLWNGKQQHDGKQQSTSKYAHGQYEWNESKYDVKSFNEYVYGWKKKLSLIHI